MTKTPTDLELLNAIYERYYLKFTEYSRQERLRDSKIYVPIDCAAIAKELGVDGDIVFGRLYYHLERKYGYAQDDGSRVHFFALTAGKDPHCVNFPYLATVLATLRHEKQRFAATIWLSIVAMIVSLISIAVSLYR